MKSKPGQLSDKVSFVETPIQLRHSRVVDFSLSVNPAFSGIGTDKTVKLDLYNIEFGAAFEKIDRPDAQRIHQGTLLVELKESSEKEAKQPPYFFRVRVEGLFESMPPPASVDLEQHLWAYGSSALLSVARETLVILSARSVHGAVFLPSIVFRTKKPALPERSAAAVERKKETPIRGRPKSRDSAEKS